VEAQYRDFLAADKGKLQKYFQVITFHPKLHFNLVLCCFNKQKWAKGPFLLLASIIDGRR